MALPKLSPEQKMEALKKAQEVRRARRLFKEQVKHKEISLEEAINTKDPVILRLRVLELLKSLPGIGKIKARRIMEDIGIDENRWVKGLGRRQQEELLALLGDE